MLVSGSFFAAICRILVHATLSAIQQIWNQMLAVLVRRRHPCAMRQAHPTVHANVKLHPEIPLLTLPGLVHLRIACLVLVLRRNRRADDRRIHDRPGLHIVLAILQILVHPGKQRLAQFLRLQKPPEMQ